MANLIITVISIALVAVAALMGAYYGGTAFMEGQAKAQANKVINLMEQTEVAYNICMAQDLNSRDGGACESADIASNGDLMTNNYLSANPFDQICSDYTCQDQAFGYINGMGMLSVPGFSFISYGTKDIDAATAKKDFDLCKAIAKKAGGDTALPRLKGAGYFPANGSVYKMDCTFQDEDSNGVATMADTFFVYYKF